MRKTIVGTVGLVLVTSGLFSAAFAADSESAVKAVNDGFYAALAKVFIGDTSAMESVWSHAEDIVYMGPDGGRQTGWKPVFANWKEQAAKKLGGKVSPQNVSVVVGKNLAVVHAVETGENKNADGKPLAVSIRATNVYRLEGAQWKMIAHHTDILPFLKKKTGK